MNASESNAISNPGELPGELKAAESSAVDWHPADVLAALKKRGHSLAALSVANGYHPTAVGKALKQPWPAVESIVATALEVAPQEIWPSRYDALGRPLPRAKTRTKT
jgi:Ner family transcriptional regulator